jgi:hypothetical protein
MNDAQGSFANSDEEMHFLSCNFCLKKCLDEPTQFKIRLQCGHAHQPARTDMWLSFNSRMRHGLNHTKDHVQAWKDLKVHEKVVT